MRRDRWVLLVVVVALAAMLGPFGIASAQRANHNDRGSARHGPLDFITGGGYYPGPRLSSTESRRRPSDGDVHHTFKLICAPGSDSTLTVRWDDGLSKHIYRLEGVDSVTCSPSPDKKGGTWTGTGHGTCDGVLGATSETTFHDNDGVPAPTTTSSTTPSASPSGSIIPIPVDIPPPPGDRNAQQPSGGEDDGEIHIDGGPTCQLDVASTVQGSYVFHDKK